MYKLFVIIIFMNGESLSSRYSDEIYASFEACDAAANQLIAQHASAWYQLDDVSQAATLCEEVTFRGTKRI